MWGRVFQLILYGVVCATIPIALHIPKVLGDESRAKYVAKYRCDLAAAIIRGTPPHRPRDNFGPLVHRDPEAWRTDTFIVPTTFARIRRPAPYGWDVIIRIHQRDASGVVKDLVSVEDQTPFDPQNCGMPFDRTLKVGMTGSILAEAPSSHGVDEYVFHDFAVEPFAGSILVKFDYFPAHLRFDAGGIVDQTLLVRASPGKQGWAFEEVERTPILYGRPRTWEADAPGVETMLRQVSSQNR